LPQERGPRRPWLRSGKEMKMAGVVTFYRSLVGKKVVMAVTGVILVLFIIGHLIGNLKIFLGADHFNAYAAWLRTVGEPALARGQLLWMVRIVLIAAAVLHIGAAVQVSLASKRARPRDYTSKKDIETTYAARTMIWSGPLLFVYVIYHLMMFTFLTTGPGYSDTDVYHNVVLAFREPAISAVYIAAMILLGMHLWHGAWSMLQTLGLADSRRDVLRRAVAPAFAVLVTAGYIAIPLAVLAGVVH
jgi:succinate dehydrogenase cytochrome b subunit